MKLIIACLLIIPQFLIAQKSFAPLGATWKYELHSFDCSNHFLRFNAEEEIEIDGKDCSVIYAYTSRNFNPFTKKDDSLIVWENDQKVYFYQFDEFHLLFDFSMEVGDTLEYFLPAGKVYFSPDDDDEQPDTTVISSLLYVKEIEEINNNGLLVKKFKTSNPYPEEYNYQDMGYIIENIGSTNVKITGYNGAFVGSGCGPGFLCYENIDLSYPPDIDCEFPTSTKNIYSDNEIRFYPNPTYGDLTIENNTSEEIKRIEIINLNGQKIMELSTSNSTIQMDNISKGFYIIKLTFDSGIMHFAKIVKY